jgi:hypothetical protein
MKKIKFAEILLVSGVIAVGLLNACAPNPAAPVLQPGVQAPTATEVAPMEPTATHVAIIIKTKQLSAAAIPTISTETKEVKPGMNEAPIPTPFDAAMTKVVDQARADLAGQINVSVDEIELVSASSVTWSDGSLGCPRPGMMYTQVMIDGLLIKFRANGQEYEYHSGGARLPFLCKK